MVKKTRKDTDLKMPAGLSPEERAAWEAAVAKTGGGLWPPKNATDGATYVGDFVSLSEVPNKMGKKGDLQKRYVFSNEGATTAIFGSAVLNSELESLDLAVGDRVLIVFKGRVENSVKGRKPIKIFSAVKLAPRKGKR